MALRLRSWVIAQANGAQLDERGRFEGGTGLISARIGGSGGGTGNNGRPAKRRDPRRPGVAPGRRPGPVCPRPSRRVRILQVTSRGGRPLGPRLRLPAPAIRSSLPHGAARRAILPRRLAGPRRFPARRPVGTGLDEPPGDPPALPSGPLPGTSIDFPDQAPPGPRAGPCLFPAIQTAARPPDPPRPRCPQPRAGASARRSSAVAEFRSRHEYTFAAFALNVFLSADGKTLVLLGFPARGASLRHRSWTVAQANGPQLDERGRFGGGTGPVSARIGGSEGRTGNGGPPAIRADHGHVGGSAPPSSWTGRPADRRGSRRAGSGAMCQLTHSRGSPDPSGIQTGRRAGTSGLARHCRIHRILR